MQWTEGLHGFWRNREVGSEELTASNLIPYHTVLPITRLDRIDTAGQAALQHTLVRNSGTHLAAANFGIFPLRPQL